MEDKQNPSSSSGDGRLRLLVWIRNLLLCSLALYGCFRYAEYVMLIKGFGMIAGDALNSLVLVGALAVGLLTVITKGLPRLLRFNRGDMLFVFIFLFISTPLFIGSMVFLKQTTWAYYNVKSNEVAKKLLDVNLTRLAPDDNTITQLYRGTTSRKTVQQLSLADSASRLFEGKVPWVERSESVAEIPFSGWFQAQPSQSPNTNSATASATASTSSPTTAATATMAAASAPTTSSASMPAIAPAAAAAPVDASAAGTASVFFPQKASGLSPAVVWGVFTALFLAICFSFVFVVSRRWLEEEQLSFPLAKFGELVVEGYRAPGEMGGGRLPLLGTGAFWIGCACTLAFQFATYYNPGLEWRLGSFLIKGYTEAGAVPVLSWLDLPSRQFWWRPVYMAIFFMCPRQILGSVLVCHVVEALVTIIGSSLGYYGYTGSSLQGASVFPFKTDQLLGASVAFTFIMLYLARGSLANQFRAAAAWLGNRPKDPGNKERPFGITIFVVAIVLFAFWSLLIGFSIGATILFMFSLLLAMVINARGRAEIGIPTLVVFSTFNPLLAVIPILGTNVVSLTTIAAIAVYGWIFISPISQATPSILDSMKMGQTSRRSYRWVLSVTTAAVVIGIVLGLFVCMSSAADIGVSKWVTGYWSGSYESGLANQLMKSGTGFNGLHASAAGIGAIVVSALWYLRNVFTGFPIHPMGYLLCLNDQMHQWSLGLIVAFVIKSLGMHYGGMKTYMRLVPFMIGMISGQVGGAFIGSIMNMLYNTNVYMPTF